MSDLYNGLEWIFLSDEKNYDDYSPLMRAAFDGNLSHGKDLIKSGVADLLQVDQHFGMNALELATIKNHVEFVDLLLREGRYDFIIKPRFK